MAPGAQAPGQAVGVPRPARPRALLRADAGGYLTYLTLPYFTLLSFVSLAPFDRWINLSRVALCVSCDRCALCMSN